MREVTMRKLMMFVLLLAVVVVAVAAVVFKPVLDKSVTTVGTIYYTDNMYPQAADSTHVTFQTSDSLKFYTILYVRKTADASLTAFNDAAVDSVGPAAGVTIKSWRHLPSGFYAYAVRCSVVTVDATSGKVRLRAYETED
jgi:hypothetical protein